MKLTPAPCVDQCVVSLFTIAHVLVPSAGVYCPRWSSNGKRVGAWLQAASQVNLHGVHHARSDAG
jgi:hypothetical protein